MVIRRCSSSGTGEGVQPGSNPVLEPIGWRTILRWARRTLRADLRHHAGGPRPWSARRAWGVLAPSLKRPVFLIGAPRSGTTFLGECLSALPEISYHHEPIATKAAARYVYCGIWPRWKARLFYRAVYRWLMRVHGEGHLRFAEKTPRNCFLIPFLADVFPDAQFVHIIRDGRDASLSHSKRPWLQAGEAGGGRREPGGYPYGPYARFWVEPHRRIEFEETSDLHRCIWAWRRYTEAALGARDLLDQRRYVEIRYESLVSRPEEVGRGLLEFLGISGPASQATFWSALGRATDGSVGRWRRELTAEQVDMIEIEAGDLLAKLGYGEPETAPTVDLE